MMTKTIKHFYLLNQLLFCKGVDLEDPAFCDIDKDKANDWLNRVKSLPVESIDDVTKVFINLFRTDEYAKVPLGDGNNIVGLNTVVAALRARTVDVTRGLSFASNIIHGVSCEDDAKLSIKDGILHIPTAIREAVNIDDCIRDAFSYVVCGCKTYNTPAVEFARKLQELYNSSEPGEVKVDEALIEAVVNFFEKRNVSPLTFVRTALTIPDVEETFKAVRSVCWWADPGKGFITMVVPHVRNKKAFRVPMDTQTFSGVCDNDPTAPSRFVVRGNTIEVAPSIY